MRQGTKGKAKGKKEVAKDTERREVERHPENTRKDLAKVVEGVQRGGTKGRVGYVGRSGINKEKLAAQGWGWG